MTIPQLISRLNYWLPAISVATLISIFSTRYFSSEQTGHVIIPILHWLFPSANHHMLRVLHFGLRKLAHVTEFGLFSVTVFHGIRGELPGWRLSWALATLAIAASYAGLDEWHQTFVPMREARLRDVLIDTSGALLAQSLVWLYARWKWKSSGPSDIPENSVKH